MAGLVQKAAATAAAHEMFPDGGPVVALVSGGADSVALLRALADGVFGPVAFSVLHVDHRLRGAHSDADAEFVRDLCAALGVVCRIAHVDVANVASRHGLNLEDAGRRVRYAEAARELEARRLESDAGTGSGRIATAHTLDDRAETLLMRLAQGAGAGGLTSLAYLRGDIVRPLLDCTRADVLAYLGSMGQTWCEDTTNLDTTRLRARVRVGLMPLMREINPRFDEAIARTLAVLGDEDDLIEELARERADAIAETSADEVRIDRDGLASLPRALQRRVVRLLVRDVFEEASRLDFEHVEAICDGAVGLGFAHDLPDGLRAFAEYGRLIISRNVERAGPFPESPLPVPGRSDLGAAGTLTAMPGGRDEMSAGRLEAVLDADALRGPLSVTAVRAGDRMRPLGMEGSRKVSDILIDAKVPARARPLVPVVRDGERIVWVAGVRQSEEYRVRPGTTRTVRLEWEPRSQEGTQW
jgi:tRNA(Ile)-lysidine synthase